MNFFFFFLSPFIMSFHDHCTICTIHTLLLLLLLLGFVSAYAYKYYYYYCYLELSLIGIVYTWNCLNLELSLLGSVSSWNCLLSLASLAFMLVFLFWRWETVLFVVVIEKLVYCLFINSVVVLLKMQYYLINILPHYICISVGVSFYIILNRNFYKLYPNIRRSYPWKWPWKIYG